jgi:hypothetical protein
MSGDMKSVVYTAEVSDTHVLQQQMQNGLEMTHVTPEIFQWVRHSLLRRATFRVESQGGHILISGSCD